ncbi:MULTISPECIES: hypothetical protein [Microbacterium]|uniref:Integral membrane protein n=1 Tax=Microbacterium wangchenii TaxID=2541726 RepID=A0ABX5SV69_9MICO|nr:MULTISPECIES: hypothetical protein [Microbacterium]MCK6065744.1 hypothetical protein [Microbacterium sp. EYE_512]QBR90061.1 hypothetical protein E4K62_16055 [Microbacterium wangchenii]
MTQLIVSALLWVLVASLLILRRGRTDRSILWSALTIAVAMTLSTDSVYRPVDLLLGGGNLVTLAADLALMVGIFFLGRAIAKATEYRPRIVRLALGRTVLVVALVSAVVAFALIDRGVTTTTFMLDYGAQPAAAAYSVIQFAYDGIVLTAMAAVATRQVRLSEGVDRLPAVSLLIGSALGLGLVAVVVAMDIAHLSGNVSLMLRLGAAYSPLVLSTFVFLCVGLASQPAIRWLRARSRARATSELVSQTAPIWQRANRVRPGMSQQNAAGFSAADAETRLHRQLVEIRDAAVDPRVSFALSEAERLLVEAAEAHLLGSGSGVYAPSQGVPARVIR